MSTILCFGDSNTFGYIPGGAGRFDLSTRYAGVLAQLLGAEYTIAEDGVCGRTSVFEDAFCAGRCGIADIRDAVRAAQPEVLVLMLGTNDCKAQFASDAAGIARGMEQLALAALTEQPDLHVVLVSPVLIRPEALACGDYDAASFTASRHLATAYADVAARHGWGFWDAARSAVASPVDGEHLTAQGHATLARDLAAVVRAR